MLKIDAFRTRLVGDDAVLHDTLRIGMTVPGPGRTFTFATHDWDESGVRFLKAAGEEITRSSQLVNLNRGNEPDADQRSESHPRVI